MSTACLISAYLEINILLVVSFAVWKTLLILTFRRPRFLSPSQLLKMGHVFLGVSLISPLTSIFFPAQEFTAAPIQIWSAGSFRSASTLHQRQEELISLSFNALHSSRFASLNQLSGLNQLALSLLTLGAVFALFQFLKDLRKLVLLIASSHRVRQIGSVKILVHDRIPIAISFWLPWTSYVMLPSALLGSIQDFRISVRHEIQHHRQRDTLWVHLVQISKALFFWNPMIHFWEKSISSLQEFACDEALLKRGDLSPHAYGSCLLTAAEQILDAHCPLVGTTGMAVSASGATLKGRIDMMFSYRKRSQRSRKGAWIGALVGTAAVALLFSVAYASQGLVHDRRVTMEEAQKLLQNAQAGSQFPIVLNTAVLEQLNRLVGTPDGREFMKGSLARKQSYEPYIEDEIKNYTLPEELDAIPITETGYKNTTTPIAAGIWSFVPETARNYGMQVTSEKDDRLDYRIETVGAMRYLSANQLRFQDWQLAILAYNAGEKQVQKGIDATGSRDAWKLIEAGYDGDQNYLAKVMAAIIIEKNPSILD